MGQGLIIIFIYSKTMLWSEFYLFISVSIFENCLCWISKLSTTSRKFRLILHRINFVMCIPVTLNCIFQLEFRLINIKWWKITVVFFCCCCSRWWEWEKERKMGKTLDYYFCTRTMAELKHDIAINVSDSSSLIAQKKREMNLRHPLKYKKNEAMSKFMINK